MDTTSLEEVVLPKDLSHRGDDALNNGSLISIEINDHGTIAWMDPFHNMHPDYVMSVFAWLWRCYGSALIGSSAVHRCNIETHTILFDGNDG